MFMIDLLFSVLRKIVFASIATIFVLTVTYAPQLHTSDTDGDNHISITTTQIAHAGGPVVEIGPNKFTNAITTIQTTGSFLIENILDGIVWSIAKQFLSNMVASIVDWINSGFQGSPAFVQDLGGFLLQAADEGVGEYLNSLGGLGSFVCSPFRLDVQLAVALQYDLDRENRQVECTLTGVINNFEDFIGGVSQDSHISNWFAISAQPRSTPYGSILTARSQARLIARNAQGEQLNLLNFGDGFLSGTLCQNVAGPNGSTEECFITKPGRVISDQLNKALGAGQDTLIAADEINEIVAALLGQLTQQAVTGAAGLLGLSGGSGFTYSGYSRGSFVADLADGTIDGQSSGGGTGADTIAGTDTIDDVARNFMAEGLIAQSTTLTELDGYIEELGFFIASPWNDEEDKLLAEFALDQASTTRERIVEDIAEVTPIVEEYGASLTAYETAPLEERIAIRQRQSELIQQYSTIGLITEQEFEAYAAQWDLVLDQNVQPPYPPECLRDGRFFDPTLLTPDCFGGFNFSF